MNDTLRDFENGVSEEELQEKYQVARKNGDYSRLVVYAGTGSGLVTKEKQTVLEILDEVDEELVKRVEDVNKQLNTLYQLERLMTQLLIVPFGSQRSNIFVLIATRYSVVACSRLTHPRTAKTFPTVKPVLLPCLKI